MWPIEPPIDGIIGKNGHKFNGRSRIIELFRVQPIIRPVNVYF